MTETHDCCRYLQAVPFLFVSLDTNGLVVFINQRACDTLGLPAESIIGKNWFETFLPPDNRHEVRQSFEQLIAGEQTIPSYFENTVTIHTGEQRLIAWRNIVVRDGSGRVEEILATGEDITESRTKLLESEARFRVLFDANVCAIAIAERQSMRLLLTNQRMAKMTGYTLQELNSMHVPDLHPESFKEQISHVFQTLDTNAEKKFGAIPTIGKAGNMILCDITLRRLPTNGCDCVACFLVDVTERQINLDASRRAMEATRQAKIAAKAANRAKSEFLSTISHELRTPLHPIIGFSQLLLDSDLSGDQHEQAKLIYKHGQALLLIINQLLELSEMEAGKLEIFLVPCDVRAILKEIMFLHEKDALSKSLTINADVAQDVPELLMLDVAHVKQVLAAFVTNAIKFSENGIISLHACMGRRSAPNTDDIGKKLLIEVRDIGKGISRDNFEKIFLPFVQIDSSMARSHSGVGLGLTIARRLARLMGGEIEVSSELGRGSAFTLILPAAQVTQNAD